MMLHGFNTVFTLWLDKQRRIFSVSRGSMVLWQSL